MQKNSVHFNFMENTINLNECTNQEKYQLPQVPQKKLLVNHIIVHLANAVTIHWCNRYF